MKRNQITVIIGIVLAVVFAFLLFSFQVRTTEVAVVTTFSKPTRDITEPGGPNFRWPWPIQKVYFFDKRVQTFEDKFTQDYTADKTTLLTSVFIGWRITDPKLFFPKFKGGSVLEAEKILGDLVRNAKTATVGKHPLSDFVSVTGGGTNFVAIENEMRDAIRSRVEANNYGIAVDFLGIKRLGFPEPVTQDVFTQMTSERQVLIEQLQRDGEARAQMIRSDADRRAAEMVAVAKGKATEIRGKGEVEAAKSLPVFQQNPELASFFFQLTALEESLKDRSTLIFDQSNVPFNLFRGVTTNMTIK
jgi:membrane protease subunit HflC